MAPTPVLGIAEAREQLAAAVRRFRDDPHAEPIYIGSHRKPQAVLVPLAAIEEGGVATVVEPMLVKLRRLAPLIRRIAEVNGFENVRVFGSVARSEETPESDVDLLVKSTKGRSYFDLAQLAIDLEMLLERPVDLSTEGGLRGPIGDHIRAEALEL